MKKTVLIVLFSLFAFSSLAEPDHRPGNPGFNVRHVDMGRDHYAFTHMSPVIGHANWNHMGGALYYGPYWSGNNYWYWHHNNAAWIPAAGITVGAAVGLATVGACCW